MKKQISDIKFIILIIGIGIIFHIFATFNQSDKILNEYKPNTTYAYQLKKYIQKESLNKYINSEKHTKREIEQAKEEYKNLNKTNGFKIIK